MRLACWFRRIAETNLDSAHAVAETYDLPHRRLQRRGQNDFREGVPATRGKVSALLQRRRARSRTIAARPAIRRDQSRSATPRRDSRVDQSKANLRAREHAQRENIRA